jgi:hypothetical protein
MKSPDEYDALLQKFMKCMVWEKPEENPYYLWLESRRNDPLAQNELTFAHFIKHSIKEFYEGA